MFKVALLALVLSLSGLVSPSSGSPLTLSDSQVSLYADGGQGYNTGNGGG